MTMQNRLSALVLATLLAACGSAPPAPADRFYRLQAEALPAAMLPAGGLEIREVNADSLYAERAIVFTQSSDPRQLRQYHYHLWLYPPAQTLREHLRASLAHGDVKRAALRADLRIVAFERVLDGRAGSALAAVQVSVAGSGGAVLDRTYRATEAATDDSFSAFTAAMELALQRIYGDLLRDLAQAAPR